MSRPGATGRGVETVTDEQAEGIAVWFFWFGIIIGFVGCIILSSLLGWYS